MIQRFLVFFCQETWTNLAGIGQNLSLVINLSSQISYLYIGMCIQFFYSYFCSVRQKVKDLIDFIQDDERLREERRKAKKNKDKFVGLSGDNNDSRYS